MQQFFRKFVSRTLVFINYSAAVIFIIACFTPHLDPRRWWITGFIGLIFPFLLLVILFFLFFWLFIKPRRSLISLICILIGLPAISVLLPWRFTSTFQLEKKPTAIRVMNWNIRRFTPFNTNIFNPVHSDNKSAIFDEIRKFNPDILCLQEFFTAENNGSMNNVRIMKEEFGFTHHIFSKDNWIQGKLYSGTAIFSKFPIISDSVIRYPKGSAKSAENITSADVIFNSDTIRIYNMHLQSFGFGPKDYSNFDKIQNQQDTGLQASKNILRKMEQTFYLHSLQADFVKLQLRNSPHPVIACGDLNDVPNSYAYYTISDDMNDCFLQKGAGIGKTFTSTTSRFLGSLPTLRIDYVLTSPQMSTAQFTRMRRKLSDHSALVADIELPEND
jgi:endonuclease/exonuclease/phosphatase family metal-dependent hydrolase